MRDKDGNGEIIDDNDARFITSITRHYQGDIYTLSGGVGGCECRGGGAVASVGSGCQCQCPPKAPTFRDDSASCVTTLQECTLADFVSSVGSDKIPYVYMPLKHQLVHPTAEVALLGLEHGGSPLVSPVCVVTKGSILTTQGWQNMHNTSSFAPPFRLFRDGGRTYVQWVGDESGRERAGGRVVRVGLLCRDAAHPSTPLFHPCLAFRVAGTHGVWEAALSAPPGSDSSAGVRSSGGVGPGEGVIIGLVVAALALVYIVAMAVFIKVKRRRKRQRDIARLAEEGSQRGKGRGGGGGRDRSRPPRPPPKPPSLLLTSDDPEDEIVDLSLNSRARRAAKERRNRSQNGGGSSGRGIIIQHDPTDGLETVHSSPLAVVETFDEEDVRPVRGQRDGGDTEQESHDTQGKKKLYFNPSYFDPELLQSPPPAALEFLSKIREMITVAKTKMKNKTYHPSLEDIPEEDNYSHYYTRSLTATPGNMTLRDLTRIDDNLEDEYDYDDYDEAIGPSDVSVQSDSLERPKENDSRSSTLKKLARRVNSHGESFVSEIIKTLDLKPRLPRPDTMFVAPPVTRSPSAQKPPLPPPKPVNARNNSPELEDDFPELIKPSMLRNVLRDGKRLTDLNNTFENFRQEMMATFQKMKKVGEAISPKSSLTRNKNKNKMATGGTIEKLESEPSTSNSGTGEGKVHKWLQSLEGRNSYTRMTDKNVVFDSRAAMTQKNNSQPPPLPEKNTKPPTPPRKTRTQAYRSISFNEVKSPISLPSNTSSKGNQNTVSHPTPQTKQVTRSLSWQNEHRHYDSNPRRPRQQMPLPQDVLNTSFGSEDDSLNDLLSEAESKVPKMTPSDSDSVYSDSRSRYKDSLGSGKEKNSASKSLSHQLSREEEITARNEIYNKNTENKTMSRLVRNSDGLYERLHENGYDENENAYQDEHTYEEIHLPSKSKQKRKAPQKPKTNTLDRKGRRNKNKRDERQEEENGQYSIYSNPESLVSEVRIQESSSPIYSGCKVTIPVADNMNSDLTRTMTMGYEQDTLERRGSGRRTLDRSGSITLDSLERPKVRKKSEDKEDTREGVKVQRRRTLPGEGVVGGRKVDKSLLDIYESRSNTRSLRGAKSQSPDRNSVNYSRSTVGPVSKPGSFYLNNMDNNTDNNNRSHNSDNNNTRTNSNNNSISRNNITNIQTNTNSLSSTYNSKNTLNKNNDSQKNIRTFKDYQEMRFQRGSTDSEVNSNSTSTSPLPVSGTSFNLNFRSSSPHKETRDARPPLPPKIRNPEVVDESISPRLPPRSRGAPPPLPLKNVKRSDSLDAETAKPRLPEKSRKKKDSPLSRPSSEGSIPELTEEEARSILHGVLAHPDARLSPLHEEADTPGRHHFLGLGNTAGDSDSRDSVPCLDIYSSGSIESPTSTPAYNSTCPRHIEVLGRGMEASLNRQLHISGGKLRERGEGIPEPSSPGSEARVSGEFILSTIGRSPSLRRQSSLGKEQKSGFRTRLRSFTEGEIKHEEDVAGKGMEMALALKAKSELEKHFKEESDSETIKRTWRKIIEKREDCKEEKDRGSVKQQYRGHRVKDNKLKQEDSGYHSTDSSDSTQNASNSSNNSAQTSNISGNSSSDCSLPNNNTALDSNLHNPALNSRRHESQSTLQSSIPATHNSRHQSFSTSSNSASRPYLTKRSSSLTRLEPGPWSPESWNYESFGTLDHPRHSSAGFQRASLRASLSRRFQGCEASAGLSVYVNNDFAHDDDVLSRRNGSFHRQARC